MNILTTKGDMMSKSKAILFEDLAEQLALLNDQDRSEFAQFLVANYSYTAGELGRDIGHAEMDADYGPYESEIDYQRQLILT
jgi:hypothetical protein